MKWNRERRRESLLSRPRKKPTKGAFGSSVGQNHYKKLKETPGSSVMSDRAYKALSPSVKARIDRTFRADMLRRKRAKKTGVDKPRLSWWKRLTNWVKAKAGF